MLPKRENPAPLAGGHRATQDTQHSENTRVAAELQQIARAVRRIGCGLRSDPEAIAIAKDDVATRLHALARDLGAGHG